MDSQKTYLCRIGELAMARKRTVIVALCAVVFVLLLHEVFEGELLVIDEAMWTFAASVPFVGLAVTVDLAKQVSDLASPVSLLAMLLIIAAFAPGKRPGICCAVNLVCAIVINVVLKNLIERPRPDFATLGRATETGFSFPSGHAMVAMAFFGLLIWLVWRYQKNRPARIALCTAFGLIIVLVAFSRIVLGVHYATDVIAGLCVSLAWLAIYTRTIAPVLLEDPEPR